MSVETEQRVPEHPGWKPWWVRVAEFDGHRVMIIDSRGLPETTRKVWEEDWDVPALTTMRRSDMEDSKYWVRHGPVPCVHIGPCPFPGEPHAEELYATDDLAEAEAAFELACERLREGG